MKAAMTTVLLALSLSTACTMERAGGSDPRPKWLAALIVNLEAQPVANPSALIARYDYQGKTVYYLPPRCCDIPSNVYDAAGSIICHADGGFSGDGDGRCADFFTLRKNEKVIWRDLRGAS